MKVLTIQQPYATLIALREKSIETRGWRPDYLGPVLIHAGKSTAMIRDCSQYDIKRLLARHGITRYEQLPLGMAVAVSKIVGVSRTECLSSITPQERLLGNYSAGRWGWQLSGTRRLDTAFPLRGAQRLFDWAPPPGFVWTFRDRDPDAPVETPEQREARHQATQRELYREATRNGPKMTGRSVNG
jgi:hypothetical protein